MVHLEVTVEVVRLVVMMDSLVATQGSREVMAVVVVEGAAEEAAQIMDHKEDHTEVEEGEVVVVVMEVKEDHMVVVEEEVVMVEEEVCS
jgi:hypothetical protein